jgi:prepilin-type processing-associated H-X9-DG protein
MLPGMGPGHHVTYEPWGNVNIWGKGLSKVPTMNMLTGSGTTFTNSPTIISNPEQLFPILWCPNWNMGVSSDYLTPYTPHGKRYLPAATNRQAGAPMDRNFGYSDGHVEYLTTQP